MADDLKTPPPAKPAPEDSAEATSPETTGPAGEEATVPATDVITLAPSHVIGADQDVVQDAAVPEAPVAVETPAETPAPAADVAQAWGAPQPNGRSGLLPVALLAGAAVVTIAAVTAGVISYVMYSDLRQANSNRDDARSQVCDYAKSLVTYDYNNLDPYFKGVLDGATGDFKSLFSGQSKYLKTDLVQGQVKSAPSKIECGVKSADASHAEIVLSIGQIGSSVATKGQPQPAQISMVATAQKINGRWRVSNLQTPSQVIP